MELKKAQEHYKKKKYGKCITCQHAKIRRIYSDESIYSDEVLFCKVRKECLYYNVDWLKIKFCKYIERKQEDMK